jgi:hypothetical protein
MAGKVSWQTRNLFLASLGAGGDHCSGAIVYRNLKTFFIPMSDNGWNTTFHRGQQTLAAWGQHAPALTVGDEALTLAQHRSDVEALPTAAQLVQEQTELADDQRAARDAVVALIKDLSTRLPRKLDGELSASDAFHKDIAEVRTIEMAGLDSVLRRGQRVVALWKKFNARRAALQPPKPALLVGGHALADLETAIEPDLVQALQAVEDALSDLNEARSALRGLEDRVDRNNKRWYAAWQGEYLPGSPEYDALSQIETGSSSGGGGNGGNGGGTGTVPAKATIGSVSQVSPGDWVLYGIAANGAASFKIEERVDGGAWGQIAQEVPAGDYVLGARTTRGRINGGRSG